EDPLPSLADRRATAPLRLSQVAARARRLRPSLAATPVSLIPPGEAGIALGSHVTRGLLGLRRRRPVLYSSWEDVVVAVMAPRAGKTTALTTPAMFDAPGPVIATSNKPDVWTTTIADRQRHGRCWLFDPQTITHQPQTWWWNPLQLTTTWEDAFRFAGHFITAIRADARGGEEFWNLAAHDLLTCFVLAAACDGRTLADVQAWLSDVASREPARILAAHGFHAAARAVAGRQSGAPETRDGVYETARTAASCLSDPRIMRWVTPSATPLPTVDVTAFPASTDTLYLLSKDGAGSAAPLVAALTDQVLQAAVRAAEANGGRLDPPLLAVLDEAANICKISDLPQLYSHLGSRGILPITILQSYPQGVAVWGEHGMNALWSAATIKLIGAGIDDPRLAEDLSRLVGEHDVPVGSLTRDGSGLASWQTSTRRQRILEPAQIRALPKGTALLLATGIPVTMIRLLPWYNGPHATRIQHDTQRAEQAITEHARTHHSLHGRGDQ
ncbi:MAG: type IV secretory system conjugative DNA transfer family protein, partial [Dactylosporangium sp.]|nr:type IV secretory system conjugative DNA transfer family protein [Dactylosporangium sp.]